MAHEVQKRATISFRRPLYAATDRKYKATEVVTRARFCRSFLDTQERFRRHASVRFDGSLQQTNFTSSQTVTEECPTLPEHRPLPCIW